MTEAVEKLKKLAAQYQAGARSAQSRWDRHRRQTEVVELNWPEWADEQGWSAEQEAAVVATLETEKRPSNRFNENRSLLGVGFSSDAAEDRLNVAVRALEDFGRARSPASRRVDSAYLAALSHAAGIVPVALEKAETAVRRAETIQALTHAARLAGHETQRAIAKHDALTKSDPEADPANPYSPVGEAAEQMRAAIVAEEGAVRKLRETYNARAP